MITKAYANVSAFLATYKNDQRGVTAIEYGLIGIAMAAAITTVFSDKGSFITGLTAAFNNIGDKLTNAAK